MSTSKTPNLAVIHVVIQISVSWAQPLVKSETEWIALHSHMLIHVFVWDCVGLQFKYSLQLQGINRAHLDMLGEYTHIFDSVPLLLNTLRDVHRLLQISKWFSTGKYLKCSDKLAIFSCTVVWDPKLFQLRWSLCYVLGRRENSQNMSWLKWCATHYSFPLDFFFPFPSSLLLIPSLCSCFFLFSVSAPYCSLLFIGLCPLCLLSLPPTVSLRTEHFIPITSSSGQILEPIMREQHWI